MSFLPSLLALRYTRSVYDSLLTAYCSLFTVHWLNMYDLIYIYEFEGDLSKEIVKIADEDYVGFWKESGYSFLFFKKPKRPCLEQLPAAIRSELTIRHEDWESGTPIDLLHVGRITLHPPWLRPSADRRHSYMH